LFNIVELFQILSNFAELCRTLSKSVPQRSQPELSPSTARGRLAALGEKKPGTKAAQLRMLWPEIKAALDRSHTLKAVCECLEADGLKMSIYTLGSYVARMRRGSPETAQSSAAAPILSTMGIGEGERREAKGEDERSPDPLANVRKSQAKRPAFDYRPELADPDKLI
jgi:hypothetical protein